MHEIYYNDSTERTFDHEKLDVYQIEPGRSYRETLRFIEPIEPNSTWQGDARLHRGRLSADATSSLGSALRSVLGRLMM
jgi:hypothetical protein